MRGNRRLLRGRALGGVNFQGGHHRAGQRHLLRLEIKPESAAAIGHLEQQLVFARHKTHFHLVLIRRHAAADFFVGDKFAVEPNAKAVITAQRKLQRPRRAGLDGAIKIMRAVCAGQRVHLAVDQIFRLGPLQFAVRLFQVHGRLVHERLRVRLVKVRRAEGPDAMPRRKCHAVGSRRFLGSLPFGLAGGNVRALELLGQRRDGSINGAEFFLISRQRHLCSLLRAHGSFLQVRKERAEAVKILRGEGVKLVVMAFRAAERAGHPNRGGIAHAVGEIFRGVLLGLRAALARVHVQPVVARGNELRAGAVFQKVARNLLPREPVKRQVVVKRVDDVVAIQRLRLMIVRVVANGVRVPHHVQPVHRHALAVMFAGQQTVHQLPVRVRRLVIHERLHFRPRRRQPREIKRHPPNQRPPIRRLRRRKPLPLHSRQHKPVNIILRKSLLLHLRRRCFLRRHISPVLGVLAALFHPFL